MRCITDPDTRADTVYHQRFLFRDCRCRRFHQRGKTETGCCEERIIGGDLPAPGLQFILCRTKEFIHINWLAGAENETCHFKVIPGVVSGENDPVRLFHQLLQTFRNIGDP